VLAILQLLVPDRRSDTKINVRKSVWSVEAAVAYFSRDFGAVYKCHDSLTYLLSVKSGACTDHIRDDDSL